MSDFEDKVEVYKDSTLAMLRKWKKEETAKEIMRDYLSEEGIEHKGSSKLNELLDERHKLALYSADENVKLKAIDSSLQMAAGPEKVVATQNNHYTFGEFLDKLPKPDEK